MSPKVETAKEEVLAVIDRHAESMSKAECIEFMCATAEISVRYLKVCVEEQEGTDE